MPSAWLLAPTSLLTECQATKQTGILPQTATPFFHLMLLTCCAHFNKNELKCALICFYYLCLYLYLFACCMLQINCTRNSSVAGKCVSEQIALSGSVLHVLLSSSVFHAPPRSPDSESSRVHIISFAICGLAVSRFGTESRFESLQQYQYHPRTQNTEPKTQNPDPAAWKLWLQMRTSCL